MTRGLIEEAGTEAGTQATLLQTTFGTRLPIVQGVSFSFLAAFFAIITYGFSEALAAFAGARVRLTTLTTFEIVVAEALARGTIDGREAALVRSWLADPHAWDDR